MNTRRRLMLCAMQKAESEVSLVLVDENNSRLINNLTDYTYKYCIYVNKTWYVYGSNYPIYAGVLNGGGLQFVFAGDVKRQSGTVSKSLLGEKNGVQYYYERYQRSASEVATVVANYPIYEWRD